MNEMKTAIMGDAHANPRALEVAIADARALGCGRFVFLGDATGYGADVRKTVRLVRENFDAVLMGNHDAVCCEMDRRASVIGNGNYALDRRQATELTEEELEWMCGLPYVQAEGGVAYVHGDFTNPKGWEYVMDERDVMRNLCARDERILFCAHTHAAAIWEVDSEGHVTMPIAGSLVRPAAEAESIMHELRPDCRYVVNCGSVGYPRNDRSNVYAVLDDLAQTVAIRRLPFDIETYRRDLETAGVAIPGWLAD